MFECWRLSCAPLTLGVGKCQPLCTQVFLAMMLKPWGVAEPWMRSHLIFRGAFNLPWRRRREQQQARLFSYHTRIYVNFNFIYSLILLKRNIRMAKVMVYRDLLAWGVSADLHLSFSPSPVSSPTKAQLFYLVGQAIFHVYIISFDNLDWNWLEFHCGKV